MESVKFVNLTPHEIKIVGEDGEVRVVPPSGKVARVNSFGSVFVDGKELRWFLHPCDNCKHADAKNCPAFPPNEEGEGGDGFIGIIECELQEPYKYLIVSQEVAQAVPHRRDVVASDMEQS